MRLPTTPCPSVPLKMLHRRDHQLELGHVSAESIAALPPFMSIASGLMLPCIPLAVHPFQAHV